MSGKRLSWRTIARWAACWNCCNPRLAFLSKKRRRQTEPHGRTPAGAGLAARAKSLRILRVPGAVDARSIPDRPRYRGKTRGPDDIGEFGPVLLFLQHVQGAKSRRPRSEDAAGNAIVPSQTRPLARAFPMESGHFGRADRGRASHHRSSSHQSR